MTITDGRWTGSIWDTHLHLDRNGRFIDAALDFARTGGSHMCLVHKPRFGENLPTSIEEVRSSYQNTLEIAEIVRRKCNIDVRVILGPHHQSERRIRQARLGATESRCPGAPPLAEEGLDPPSM